MLPLLTTAAHDRPDGYLSAVDPRAKILMAIMLSIAVVVVRRWETVGIVLAAAALAMLFCGLPLKTALKRLLPLNVLMLFLLLLLPLTTPGTSACHLGPLRFTQEGLQLGATIAMKGNAVLMIFIALLGTMDPVTLGHAMGHLHIPDKLIYLLLFTVRYLDVLHREYLRLRAAMKVRAFRPQMNRHTYRSLGYLVGMLLVRSFDRAERIAAAMKCRGFQGHFHMLDHFAFSRRDTAFCTGAALLLLLLLGMELS